MGYLRYVKKLDVQRTGMIYRFRKEGDNFIHTRIEGQLLYDLGRTPKDIVGKTLNEFLPNDYASIKEQYYLQAWKGKFVHYESMVNGIHYIASLRPIFENGKVIEVEGSCINVTDQTKLPKKISNRSGEPSEDLTHTIQKSVDTTRYPPNHFGKRNLMIKENNSFIFVPLLEIIFIERVDRKSVIHTNSKQYETYETLNSLHQQLDDNFIRCHKSYILNMDYLEVIEQCGQKYYGHFKNYRDSVKISTNIVKTLKMYKSN